MPEINNASVAQYIRQLLAGTPDSKGDSSRSGTTLLFALICILLFPYGATLGAWRDPLQGIFAGIKFPLVVLLTTAINGLINGILGKLFGTNLSFLESFRAVCLSFLIAALILASLSPVFFFLLWTSPPLGSPGAEVSYSLILLSHVLAIACAGVVGNVRLYALLKSRSSTARAARRALWAWLLLNLLVGSQLSWNLRPFIGSPALPVQFLRADAFKGNFFEAVWSQVLQLFQ